MHTSCIKIKVFKPRIIEALTNIGRVEGCYKIILDCGEHNVQFYEKCGYKKKEVQMVQYLHNTISKL